MKQLLLIAAIVFFACKCYAQCAYPAIDAADIDELTRKRLSNTEVGFRYGNPYTMFNRHNYETWSLSKISTLVNKLNYHEN